MQHFISNSCAGSRQTIADLSASASPADRLLINFGAATFKEGVKRIVNNHKDFRVFA
jgi:hypothetical protein